MARIVLLAFVALLSFPAAGCVSTPMPDGPAKVDVNAVVSRIKCDIWRTVFRKFNEDRARFGFLSSWGARGHLTIAVDGTASINPGATIINPLPNSQSFSLGAGVGLMTEAINTKDIEFFLSFAEMADERRQDPTLSQYSACHFEDGLLLESDLHLEELFDTALSPVAHQTLSIGNHPGVAGGSAPALPPEEGRRYLELKKQLAAAAKAARESRQSTETNFSFLPPDQLIEKNRQEASQIDGRSQAILNNIVKPVADIIAASFPACTKEASQAKNSATVRAALITSKRIDIDHDKELGKSNTTLKEARSEETELIDLGRKVIVRLNACSKLKQPDTTPVYDPLDLISETVNFYITASGSVTPTWKLTRVSAPLAPAFLTGSRKYTNSLILAFGRADQKSSTPGGGTVTNQILVSTLRDALAGDRFRP